MKNLTDKKLTVLAGAAVHSKVVEAAKEMGVYTIVADYLTSSPAKKIADESWLYDIMDTNAIAKCCRESQVDGALAVCIDPAQRPYQELCNLLNVPCFCNAEQVYVMTDKHAFKRYCISCGVDVIPEFSMEDVYNCSVEFPVMVKPVDSRGSRGQTVCNNYEELNSAIAIARQEASNGDILIEKYMGDCQEVQVTYFFINGEAYLIRTADSYTGTKENNLEKVVACAISPSQHTQEYLDTAHKKVVAMFKRLGMVNGPIFMQGFKDGDKFRFFDPGIRLPGVDYERMYKEVYDIDLMKLLVHFALTGNCGVNSLPEDSVWLKGKRAAVLFPTIKPGEIARISGLEKVSESKGIISYWTRYDVGDMVSLCNNVNQRFAEVDILAENTAELKQRIDCWYDTVCVLDTDGNDMLYERFNCNRIR